jgi:Holliday junction resolvase RusA-like endonuclease
VRQLYGPLVVAWLFTACMSIARRPVRLSASEAEQLGLSLDSKGGSGRDVNPATALTQSMNRTHSQVLPISSERDPVEVAFFVAGIPAPQGSKRAFRNQHTQRIQQVETSKRLPDWRQDIRAAAESAMADRPPITGAVAVDVDFTYQRPKSHLTTKSELRSSAPRFAATGADIDKLVRAILDAIQVKTGGCLIADDKLVVELHSSKTWDEKPGARIAVRELR